MAENDASHLTLGDLGERRLISEVLLPAVDGGGDDCAAIPDISGTVLVSTDPVPEPAAHLLGGDSDPFWKGWLLVTINASDLAASGAFPLAFLAALEAPAHMDVRQFRRFVEGIRASCLRQGLRYAGGNVREGERLAGTGTSIGICRDWPPVTRDGARAGDVVVTIGRGGVFWRDALNAIERRLERVDVEHSPLFAPVSEAHVMWRLAQARLLHCAMDNSDGLLPTLNELARVSGVIFELDLPALRVDDAEASGVDPARLWMGWGDWNVIATLSPESIQDAMQICETNGGYLQSIGRCVAGNPAVILRRGRAEIAAPRLESERFAKDSWLRVGIGAYRDALLSIPLP